MKYRTCGLTMGFKRSNLYMMSTLMTFMVKVFTVLKKQGKTVMIFFPSWDDLGLFNKTVFYKTSNLACKC